MDSFLANLAVPDLATCLRWTGPATGVIFLVWVCRNADALVRRMFPHLEWERQLGWLNIGAERRANAVLSALRNLFYGLLAVALLGIVWSAHALVALTAATELNLLLAIFYSWSLTGSLLLWIYYFRQELLPRLQREFEEEELKRFRAEMLLDEDEPERASDRPDQVKSPALTLLPGVSSKRIR